MPNAYSTLSNSVASTALNSAANNTYTLIAQSATQAGFKIVNNGAAAKEWSGKLGDGTYDALRFVPWGAIDPLFEAVVQATEEAIVDAMVAAEEMRGREGHRSPGLPRQRVADAMRTRRQG